MKNAYLNVQPYLNSMGTQPLLTPSEEIQLSKLIQQGQKDGATKREKLKAQRAVRRMVMANMRLSITVAKRYVRYCKSMDLKDLAQEGAYGLHRAAELFDPTRGYKFSTYAHRWLQQSMTRAISNQDSTVRLPVHVRDQIYRCRKLQARLVQNGSNLPTLEIAKEARANPHTLLQAHRVSEISSLNFVGEGSESELGDFVASEPSNITHWEEFGVEKTQFAAAFLSLQERESLILRKYYGIGVGRLSLSKIAEEMGISRQRAGQLKARAENNLRSALLIQGAADLSR